MPKIIINVYKRKYQNAFEYIIKSNGLTQKEFENAFRQSGIKIPDDVYFCSAWENPDYNSAIVDWINSIHYYLYTKLVYDTETQVMKEIGVKDCFPVHVQANVFYVRASEEFICFHTSGSISVNRNSLVGQEIAHEVEKYAVVSPNGDPVEHISHCSAIILYSRDGKTVEVMEMITHV